MFQNDMDRKMQFSMDKVKRALEKGNGHTILSTGITGDDARMAKAVVDAGVSMLEPKHWPLPEDIKALLPCMKQRKSAMR